MQNDVLVQNSSALLFSKLTDLHLPNYKIHWTQFLGQ